MKDAKLLNILKTLSKDEFKDLRRFTQSNYFNTDPNLLLLYDALAKHLHPFNAKGLAKEVLFGKVFQGQAYNDAKWRNLLSKMTKLVEDYLCWLELERDDHLRRKLLIGSYEGRNIDFDEFKRKTEQLLSEMEALPYRDESYYLMKLELERRLYYSANSQGIVMADTMRASLSDLNAFYGLAKSKLLGELNSLQLSWGIVEDERDEKAGCDNLLVQLYSSIVTLYTTEQDEAYFSIKATLSANMHLLRPTEQKHLIKHLLDFVIRQVRVNAVKYLVEVLGIYKLAHAHDLLANNGVISNITFINIVSTAVRVGDFAWAEQFVAENIEKLELGSRWKVVSLGQGFLAFFRKSYHQTIDLLAELEFEDVRFRLLAKSLAVQSYFEVFLMDESYYQFLKYYLQSFEKYIHRHSEIGKSKSVGYIQFLRMVRQLAGAIHDQEFNVGFKQKLLKSLESQKLIVEREWLRDKITQKR